MAKKKTKKRSTKEKSAKKLKNCPVEFEFVICSSGKRLKNIKELAHELDEMSEDIFQHHVNGFNNDFSNWIEHVFGEKKLADEMRKMDDRIKIQIKLFKHLTGVIK